MASTNIQSFPGVVEIASNLTVDTNTLHVDSVAGRVGIGKTDPAFALDVSGTINATSFYLGGSELQTDPWTSDDPNIYYTTGAVGIGTNSPAKTLEVQGTLRVSNASTGGASDLVVTGTGIWDEFKILASNPAANSYFGTGVALSNDGNYAIVGAWRAVTNNTLNPTAYIYTRTGTNSWSGPTNIYPSNGTYDSFYGYSVALSDDASYAIVGAWRDDVVYQDTGSAFIYRRTGTNSWDAGVRINASDPGNQGTQGYGDFFGKSVALSGDGMYAIVGAFQKDQVGDVSGSAYIYTRTGTNSWNAGVRILSADLSAGDQYGSSVDISSDGNYAIVGGQFNTVNLANQGSAYIFIRSGSTWTQQVRLVAPDTTGSEYFGWSVSISSDGTYAIIGARSKNSGTGSAYIFKRDGSSWTQTTTANLLATDGAVQDYFGSSVSISGDGTYAVVGAPSDDDGGTNTGSAYVFIRSGGINTWKQVKKIVVTNPSGGDYLGDNSDAISISNGGYVMAGAAGYTFSYSAQGAAYIFKEDLLTLTSTIPITADGTILSFTGQHMCFPDGPMSQGQIVSANKNKYITLNGPLTTGSQAIKSSESLPVVCLSNVANDISVFGVVDRHERGGTTRVQESGIGKVTQEKELGDNRVIVNSIGEGAMWVVNTNGNLVSGDYITTSNVAGYGQKQDDDTVYSYTVAKITMDCDFEPEDLPIQVIKKDAEGNNILDTYGRIQWEDTDKTEKAYRIQYLTTEGQRTDQANAVWTAAYVGCTYHCG